jgi:DNA-binding transcriptional ArsR family regulator
MRGASTREKIYMAIADPHRRRLLDLLREQDMAAQDLANRFQISFPAISQHLRVLLDARLVVRRPEGRRRVYRAVPRGLRAVHEWTGNYQQFWAGRLRSLGAYLDDHARSREART